MTLNWDDGTVNDVTTLTTGGRSFSITHSFAQHGEYTLSVTIEDDNGGTNTGVAQADIYHVSRYNGTLSNDGTDNDDTVLVICDALSGTITIETNMPFVPAVKAKTVHLTMHLLLT